MGESYRPMSLRSVGQRPTSVSAVCIYTFQIRANGLAQMLGRSAAFGAGDTGQPFKLGGRHEHVMARHANGFGWSGGLFFAHTHKSTAGQRLALIPSPLPAKHPAHQPFTQTTCLSVCTMSTSSSCAAITASMLL
jgi:hypothetical protein